MKQFVRGLFIAVVIAAVGAGWYLPAKGRVSYAADATSSASQTVKVRSGVSFEIISAKTAKRLMDKGGVTIVDVRRQDEYAAGHVKGAIHVPNESIGNSAPAKLPDKNAVLLVYCRTGIRARDASQKLAELGYKHVYDFGGIRDWPYETEK